MSDCSVLAPSQLRIPSTPRSPIACVQLICVPPLISRSGEAPCPAELSRHRQGVAPQAGPGPLFAPRRPCARSVLYFMGITRIAAPFTRWGALLSMTPPPYANWSGVRSESLQPPPCPHQAQPPPVRRADPVSLCLLAARRGPVAARGADGGRPWGQRLPGGSRARTAGRPARRGCAAGAPASRSADRLPWASLGLACVSPTDCCPDRTALNLESRRPRARSPGNMKAALFVAAVLVLAAGAQANVDPSAIIQVRPLILLLRPSAAGPRSASGAAPGARPAPAGSACAALDRPRPRAPARAALNPRRPAPAHS